jgi:hypothetical protein
MLAFALQSVAKASKGSKNHTSSLLADMMPQPPNNEVLSDSKQWVCSLLCSNHIYTEPPLSPGLGCSGQ